MKHEHDVAVPAESESVDDGATLIAVRGGFSLVEVIVAMVMLAAVISCLAGATTYTAQQAIALANTSGRQAIALQETNRVAALDYDTIPQLGTGCDTIALNSTLRYRRCLSFNQATRYREVTVVVTPLRTGTYAETIVLRRATSTANNPLNMP